jgi:hypothetical protein
MVLRDIFDTILNTWNNTEFEAAKVWNFVRDFYYFNSELLSFFVLNVLFLIYFASRSAVTISMEVQSSKQIVLHSLAKRVRDEEARKALHEEINGATNSWKENELLTRLAPEGDLEELKRVLEEDNEVVRLKRAVDDWNEYERWRVVLAMCGVVLLYWMLIMFVWYYSYLSQSVTFLFLLITLNTIFLIAIDDPIANHEETLLPTLRDLRKDNIYIKNLVLNGTELYYAEQKSEIDIYDEIRKVTLSGDTQEQKKKKIQDLLRQHYHVTPTAATRESAIQSAIMGIENQNYYFVLRYALILNYLWRIYNLIGGYSAHLSLQHRLHI